jgi:hypothetical protein
MIPRFLRNQETLAMMKILFVLCLLSASAAFAQYYNSAPTLNSQPQVYIAPSHPAHASYTAIAQEQSVLASANFSTAQGERPLSDFPQPDPLALGTAARELKKEHAELKRSRVVWVNQ